MYNGGALHTDKRTGNLFCIESCSLISCPVRDRINEDEIRGDRRGRHRSTERQDQHRRSRSRSPPQRPRQQRYVFQLVKDIPYVYVILASLFQGKTKQ